jgi:hypothetical protein
MHFTMCRGNVNISDCTLAKMGDDGINVHRLNLICVGRSGSRTIKVQHGGAPKTGLPPIRPGDVISFAPKSDPFHPVFSAKVVSCSTKSGLFQVISIELDRDVPDSLLAGTVIADEAWRPKVAISNTHIARNRARGFWLQVPEARIENCSVTESSGPAMEIRCDINRWWEGEPAASVVVNNCEFSHCNYGPGSSLADLDVYAEGPGGIEILPAEQKGIEITNCRFVSDGLSISLRSATGAVVKGNSFKGGAGAPVSVGEGVDWSGILP